MSTRSCAACAKPLLDAGLPFTVETEARLAIVGFTGYLLWRDLNEHPGTVPHPAGCPPPRPDPNRPVHRSCCGRGGYEPGYPRRRGRRRAHPRGRLAGRGDCLRPRWAHLVLEGPPGTGKSQTTNILADQVARGRRVLFVAEKGAALDVVRRRLAEVGLAPFALDLHEHATPAQVRERLRLAIAHVPRPDQAGFQGRGHRRFVLGRHPRPVCRPPPPPAAPVCRPTPPRPNSRSRAGPIAPVPPRGAGPQRPAHRL